MRTRWLWKERVAGIATNTKDTAALALFQAATVFTVGDGRSTLFWTDRWLQGSCLQDIAPTVFAAVTSRKRRATVAEAIIDDAWVQHITTPTTVQLLIEFGKLCDLIEGVQLTPNPDTITWKFSEDQAYSAASAYGAMFLGCSTPLGARQIWKTGAPPRVRFFFWLVMHDRCWTAERRFRHGLQHSSTCVLCDQEVETMDHILLGCSFSRVVWHIWLCKLHLQDSIVPSQEPALHWWLKNRKLIPKQQRRGFDSFFFLIGWALWKERNAKTFNSSITTAQQLALLVQDEVEAWCTAGFRCLRSLVARM